MGSGFHTFIWSEQVPQIIIGTHMCSWRARPEPFQVQGTGATWLLNIESLTQPPATGSPAPGAGEPPEGLEKTGCRPHSRVPDSVGRVGPENLLREQVSKCCRSVIWGLHLENPYAPAMRSMRKTGRQQATLRLPARGRYPSLGARQQNDPVTGHCLWMT